MDIIESRHFPTYISVDNIEDYLDTYYNVELNDEERQLIHDKLVEINDERSDIAISILNPDKLWKKNLILEI